MHVTPKLYPTAGYNCPVIELMAQLRSQYPMSPEDVRDITVDLNWLETLYPSPAFPSAQRGAPVVGSTHYFAAYTWVHGGYPPLNPRVDPGDSAPGEDPRVMALMQRVRVVGHKDRPAFAPRITVNLRGGATCQGEFHGNELEWDLATETRRISALFDGIPWPRERLEDIVRAVANLEQQSRIDNLIRLCVRG
jgi:hypothetical protein